MQSHDPDDGRAQLAARRMWRNTLVGVLVALAFAKPFADWAYEKFDFLRYQPTIVVDGSRVVTPLSLEGPREPTAQQDDCARAAAKLRACTEATAQVGR